MNGKTLARTDIVIAGGGPVGMALALALAGPGAASGLNVTLVNAAPLAVAGTPGSDGRAYNLGAASMRLLDALGVRAALAGCLQPMTGIIVTDAEPGAPRPVLLDFDNRVVLPPMPPPTGPGNTTKQGDEAASWIVPAEKLGAALAGHVMAAGDITVMAPARVSGADIRPGHVDVYLDNGGLLAAQLLVAADGRASPLRGAMGIRALEWSYGQSALVMSVAHEHDHEGRAFEHFLPPGPFATLPLEGGKSSSLVWCETPETARRLLSLDEQAFATELRRRFGDELGKVTVTGARFAYPLTGVLAHDYVRPRFALLGDAAHGIHPLAGQGVNLGYRGVAALAEVLVDAALLGRDIGGMDILRRYERWRRFDAVALVAACDALNRLFSTPDPGIRWLRDTGLRLVDSLPELKRFFVQEAAGSRGDVPRLLQGKPL